MDTADHNMKLIHTKLHWDDLVIHDSLKVPINELKSRLKDHDDFVTGYRILFYGPAGAGKTFTAGLLGKEVGKDVYKIDLSKVVSKYIAETEKNLDFVLARAENKGWILIFDEADALFGKRTDIKDAHNKYSNQEVSYFLKRIEDYNGIVILVANVNNSIDNAIGRRFNSVLKFIDPKED